MKANKEAQFVVKVPVESYTKKGKLYEITIACKDEQEFDNPMMALDHRYSCSCTVNAEYHYECQHIKDMKSAVLLLVSKNGRITEREARRLKSIFQ